MTPFSSTHKGCTQIIGELKKSAAFLNELQKENTYVPRGNDIPRNIADEQRKLTVEVHMTSETNKKITSGNVLSLCG